MEITIDSKIIKFLLNVVLCLSGALFTLLLSNRYELSHVFIGSICSFFILLYLFLKKVDLSKLSLQKLILSILLSLFIVNELLLLKHTGDLLQLLSINIFDLKIDYIMLGKMLGVLVLPFLTFLVYIFVSKVLPIIINFFKTLTKVEKIYLVIVCIVGVIVSILTTNSTTAFSKPMYNGYLINYDVIYTSDSGSLVNRDAFLNISHAENDIRQPLFGVFAFPIAVIARLLSKICFFFPLDYSYSGVMIIFQFLLTSISTIMLVRLLNVDEKNKKYLYLLFSVSFPYLIFNLVLEQYVISLFYLILTIYIYFQNNKKINFMYIGAVGTLLTSGILFPLITKFKNLKQWIKDIIKCFGAFMITLIISGQLPQLFIYYTNFESLTTSFSGKISFYDKLCQFTNFVKSIFISAPGQYEIVNNNPSYQLIDFKTISIVGIVILVVLIISFVINRKEKIVQVSFSWLLFSIFILLFVGWGAPENGYILYSLYFAWAYLILYYYLLRKIFKNQKIFIGVLIISILVMLFFNINELINIFSYALKYY